MDKLWNRIRSGKHVWQESCESSDPEESRKSHALVTLACAHFPVRLCFCSKSWYGSTSRLTLSLWCVVLPEFLIFNMLIWVRSPDGWEHTVH